MEKSKIIIIEGAQGAGKTTYSDFIRHYLPHTNLYRLSGISDSSIAGYEKSKNMYFHLLDYIEGMQGIDINLLFDRTFFSEENYCRLGKKDYSFSEVYYKLVEKLNNLDFDIYFINLYIDNHDIFEKRLGRKDKANVSYAKFAVENSVKQQDMYIEMTKELQSIAKNIKVFNISTDRDMDIVKKDIIDILK